MLLAADWQNPLDRLDVNADGMLAPIDALVVSNQLPAVRGSGEEAGGYIGYPDVNGDGVVDQADMNTVVAYVNTMPTSSSGGSSTAPSSGGSSSSSSSSMYGGISMSAPATLTVNEAQQFELTFSWTEAYWIVIDAPGLSFGSVIEDGYYAMQDSNGDPFVFQSYVGNTTAGQATLTAAFPDDGASPGNGTASDVMPITITAYGYYNMSAGQTTDVTVNNVDPVLTTTLLTPSTIEEGDEAQIEIHWSDVYWYEGETDRLTLEIDWGEGGGSQAVDPASLEGCNSGNPFVGCAIAKHVYLDDNPTNTASDPYTIAVKLSDDDTGSVTHLWPLTVKNADPVVTIDSITAIDSVSPEQGGVAGRIDETEGFIVRGTVTDKGILDTFPVAELTADLNFDGNIGAGETFPLALNKVSDGVWKFEQTMQQMLDDGAVWGNDSAGNPIRLWGNETEADRLDIDVKVEDDDTGTDGATKAAIIHNIEAAFDDDVGLTYELTAEGELLSATILGSIIDAGAADYHKLSVIWGDGVAGDGFVDPLKLSPGDFFFEITREFPAGSPLRLGDLFPIVVQLWDDDSGLANMTLASCGCGCGTIVATQAITSPFADALLGATSNVAASQIVVTSAPAAPPIVVTTVATPTPVAWVNFRNFKFTVHHSQLVPTQKDVNASGALGETKVVESTSDIDAEVVIKTTPTRPCYIKVKTLDIPTSVKVAQVYDGPPLISFTNANMQSLLDHERNHVRAFHSHKTAFQEMVSAANATLELVNQDNRLAAATVAKNSLNDAGKKWLQTRVGIEGVRQAFHLDNLDEPVATVATGVLGNSTTTYGDLLSDPAESIHDAFITKVKELLGLVGGDPGLVNNIDDAKDNFSGLEKQADDARSTLLFEIKQAMFDVAGTALDE